MRDRIKYELGREVKESIEKLEFEKEEKERHEKEINKLSLGGLSDQEMLDYAMMLSQQESSTRDTTPQAPQSDFVDEDDEELMKAIIASLDSSKIDSEENSNNQADFDMPLETETWPSLPQAESSSSRAFDEHEDIDDELRYILELSKTDK